MENFPEVLKSLDILLEDLSTEQIEGIKKFSSLIDDPKNISVNQAMKIVKELNLDIEKLQKNSRKRRAQVYNENKKPKIGNNDKCQCGSGKKYKKCCIWKND